MNRLAPAAVLLCLAGVALAAPPQGPSMLELLRPTDLVGDGASPAQMHVLALDDKGAPIQGLKAKMTVDGGVATELVDEGGGLYGFTFTPEKVEASKMASVSLKGKLANKATFDRTWTFAVSPPLNRQLHVTANPALITLGVDKTASLSFDLKGGDPAALTTANLALAVSAGTVGNLTNLGGGQFSGLYTPPAGNVAQVALVTAVDAGDTARTYAAVPVPLVAKADQSVTVAPNARVILKVGGREFGPVQADAKGRAKIPVVVPPGAGQATRVVVGADGVANETPFDLKIPDTRRLALFPTAAGIPADARLQVPVRAFVVTPDGRPDEAATVEFGVSAGTIGPARHEGGGIYVAAYTPPSGNAATSATLTVKVGERAVDVDKRPLALVPLRPATLTLSSDPPTLPAGATTLTVIAHVAGPSGEGLAGRALDFVANGAKLAKVEDAGNGDYRATFTPTGKGPVEVTATVASPSTGNRLAHVIVLPSRERLPPDGLSSAMLTVATLDEFGYPVPRVDVALSVITGDGSLPTSVTTGPNGTAQIYYTAGRQPGFVAIDASAGDRFAGVSLLQEPPEASFPTLPLAGGPATKALVDAWKGTIAELRIERGG